MVRLVSFKVGQVADRMVLVSAGEITKSLASDGKVALYGILLHFNKATIRLESRLMLDEIGKFLGPIRHRMFTSSAIPTTVAGFDFNMQLSNSRPSRLLLISALVVRNSG